MVIGYAGCEAFDVILYIGRTLTKLNQRVLIVDFSNTNALASAIYHGMGLDSKSDIINYRDINYVQRVPSDDELEMFKDGVIFVVYGFNYNEDFPLPLKQMIIVTTPYPNMVEKAKQLMNMVRKESSLGLLIRDIIELDDVDRVKDMMELPVKVDNIDYLYLDMNDSRNAIDCQLKKIIRMTNISSRMKSYIKEQVQLINPKLTSAQIKKAMAMARKGD